MKNLAVEYECRKDVAATRLVEAREAVRAARTRLTQSLLLNEVEPSRENFAFLLEAERAVVQATLNERALFEKTTNGASRSH